MAIDRIKTRYYLILSHNFVRVRYSPKYSY